jgi:nucleoside 2-deoxyribosyltransferase
MRVYFAHPCFNEEQEKFKAEFLRKIIEQLRKGNYGDMIEIVDPFLHSPNIEGDRESKVKLSKSVATTCLKLLEECDLVVALVDGNDMGVAFEAGYAHCMNMPVLLISETACGASNAMLIGSAKDSFDNILEGATIKRLATALEWYHMSKKRFPRTPSHN